MKRLAIIPARKGSKRFPNKNTIEFYGFPMIEWTISQAVCIREYSKIIVTTNDEKVIEIAKKYPVEILKRDEYLCLDNVPTEPVIDDVLNKYPDYKQLMLLQPTSPLRPIEDHKYILHNYDISNNSVISYDKKTNKRNGAFYYCAVDNYIKYGLSYNEIKYFMNHTVSIDIDTEEDYKLALRYM